MLTFRLYGQVALLTPAGQPVDLSRQQLAVLAVLAMNGGTPSLRKVLTGLLWPNTESSRANRSLSQCVYAINKKHSGLIARLPDGRLALNLMSVHVQTATEIHSSVLGTPERFLESLEDYPSDAFDEWRSAESLRQRTEPRQWTESSTEEQSQFKPRATRSMLGRTTEFELAKKVWSESSAGRTRVLVVAGESGSGKTRFCQQLARYLALQGAAIRTAHCSSVHASRMGSQPDCIGSDVYTTVAVAGSEMLGDEWDVFGDNLPLEDQPTAIIIEDVQWIGARHAIWLEKLLRVADDWPLLVVLSVSTDSPADRNMVLQLVASGGHTSVWIAMRPLGDADAEAIVRMEASFAGVDLEERLRKEIVRIGDGSPLFLSELAREAAMQTRDGLMLSAKLDALYPETIDAVLQRRLLRLTQPARQVMSLLAVLGGEGSESEISTILPMPPSTFAAAASELEMHGLLAERISGIAIRSKLLRRAAEQCIGPVERARLHERIAAYLDKNGADSARVATHFLCAGRLDSARECALGAAKRLEASCRLSAAMDALRLAESASISEEGRIEVVVMQARICLLQQDFLAARKLLEGCETELSAGGANRKSNSSELGVDLLELSRVLVLFEDAVVTAEDARHRLEQLLIKFLEHGDGQLVCQTVRSLLTSAHAAGREHVIRWLVGEIASGDLARFDSHGELYILAANAESVYGQPSVARALLETSVSNGCKEDERAYISYLFVRGIVEYVSGDLIHAREYLEQANRKAVAEVVPDDATSRILSNLAVVYLEAGEVSLSEHALQRALETCAQSDRPAVLANRAAWCVECGRFDLLADVVSELEAVNQNLRIQWIGVAADTFKALWYLHHGYQQQAQELAATLEGRMSPERRDLTDRSYSEIVIARAAAASGSIATAVDRLRSAILALPEAHWAGRLRITSELARLLQRDQPREARMLVANVREAAHKHGAYLHLTRHAARAT